MAAMLSRQCRRAWAARLLAGLLLCLLAVLCFAAVLAQDEAGDAGSAGWSGEDTAQPASIGNPPPPPAEPSVEGLQSLRHAPVLPVDSKLDSALTLRDILARPEFQTEEKQQSPRQEGWFERLIKLLQQWFSKLGMKTVAGNNTATIIATVLLGGLLALLVYLLVRWVWDALASGQVIRLKDDEKSEDEMEPDTLLKLAQQALARGEVRQAIRLRFRAVLRRLPQTSAAVLLTNSQLKRRVSREYPAAAQPFGRLVVCFEDAWYGGLPVASEDYRSADGWARAVEEAIPAHSATEEQA